MFCSECGKPLEDGAAFCGNCGAVVVKEAEVMEAAEVPAEVDAEPVEVAPEVAEPAPVAIMPPPVVPPMGRTVFCNSCGTPIEGGGTFCGNCGAAVVGAVPPVVPVGPPYVKKGGGKKIGIIVAGVGALVAVIAAVLIFVVGASYNPPYEVVSMGRYDQIGYIGDGRFVVARGGWQDLRWGVVDIRGNEIIPFGRFEAPDDSPITTTGNFIVRDGRTFYVLNSRGNEITSFDRYDRVTYVTDNRFIVSIGSGSNTRAGVVDARDNEIIPLGRYTNI